MILHVRLRVKSICNIMFYIVFLHFHSNIANMKEAKKTKQWKKKTNVCKACMLPTNPYHHRVFYKKCCFYKCCNREQCTYTV